MKKKPHYVEVQINSVSNDCLNQELIFREYDDTQQGLVTKNFAVTDKVVPGVIEVMRGLAAPFLSRRK